MRRPDQFERRPCVPEPRKSQGTQGAERNDLQQDTPIEASRPGAEQPHRRRIAGPPPKYVKIGNFPPVRQKTITELREGLDEDMERTAWRSEPVDHTDMMSFADRFATLSAREEDGGQ